MNTSRRKEQFLPYAFRKSGLEITEFRATLADGVPVGVVDSDRRILDISKVGDGEIFVHGLLEVSKATLATLFPPTEEGAYPGYLALALRCSATHYRELVRVCDAPCVADSYPFRLDLKRAQLFGTLEVVPFLVRASEGRAEGGFGTIPGSRLASCRPWEIRFDTTTNVAGEFLEVRYESFKENPARFVYINNLYEVDCAMEQPILWLNSDHPRVCEVLDSKGNVGIVARVRDVMFDEISGAVWTHLFFNAAWDIRDAETSTHRWQHAVLQKFLPLMYPESSHEERIELVRVDLEDGGAPALLERFGPVLQHDLELASHFSKAAQEVT